jgi:hypothetical protein
MLELRPNCELCDKDLLPDAADARIYSYECTFCADCAESALHNVCPNCGSAFVPRPIRPSRDWRSETGLGFDKPGAKRRHTRYSRDELEAFSAGIRSIPPANR